MKEKLHPNSLWKGYQKVAFRFVFIFFTLFIVFLDWSVNPVLSKLYYYGPLSTLLDSTIFWVGKSVFQISDTIISPYDGEHNDRTYVYLLYFTMVVIAFLGTMVWSLLDRKRHNYQVLYYWFTTIVRYYLAFTMFLFALEKFFKTQFPDLGFYTLTEQVGDMSPMHLAWAFFGYSYTYNIFMGIAESAALLLLFRRTTTLGALLTMGTLANVIAVNYSYDVHAKMYPTALFVMAFVLLLRDAKSVFQFFIAGRAPSLSIIQAPTFRQPWMNKAKVILKWLLIGSFLIFQVNEYRSYKRSIDEGIEAISEYAGLYDVESFVINGDTLSKEDPLRWRQFIIGDRMLEAIRLQKDSVAVINIDVDNSELIVYGNLDSALEENQKIYNEMGLSDDTWIKMDSILIARQKISSFHIKTPDSFTLKLLGMIKNDSVHISAKRRSLELNEFRLMRRRFHWVNKAGYFY
ncbi:MAG: hypothetical protein AAGA77_03855 [Bacteroidota bacterium]